MIDYVKGSLRSGHITVVGDREVWQAERRRTGWLCGSQSRRDHDGGYLVMGSPCSPYALFRRIYGFIPSSRSF